MAADMEAPPILIVSGGSGTAGEQLVNTALAQFEGVLVPTIIEGGVRTLDQLELVISLAEASGAAIVHTLVDAELRRALVELASRAGVTAIDLEGQLLSHLSVILGRQPKGQPGLYHQQRQAYFDRVEAMEYTLAHDDGKRPGGLVEADLVLLGPSRVGKTPLAVYLSLLGYKVANIPLVPDVALPELLAELPNERVVGLLIDPESLLAHRRRRLERMGGRPLAGYTEPAALHGELETAQALYKRRGFGILETTDKSIEESATELLALLRRRR